MPLALVAYVGAVSGLVGLLSPRVRDPGMRLGLSVLAGVAATIMWPDVRALMAGN